jgi:hypothetical protein
VPSNHSQTALAAAWDDGPERPARSANGMRRLTPLFIVASPRPLTGKTFLARVLIDFLRIDGAAVRAFDLNPSGRALIDYLPVLTVKADIATTRGQVALFDRLVVSDAVAKVIDLGHGLFERFFALGEEIGFVEELRRRAVELVIIYPAEPHPASVEGYAGLRRRFPGILLVPALNDGIAKGRKLRELYPFGRAAGAPLQIPLLAPVLKLYVEQEPYTFADFQCRAPTPVPGHHAVELRSWSKRAFLEFRELELRLLLEKLRASLK